MIFRSVAVRRFRIADLSEAGWTSKRKLSAFGERLFENTRKATAIDQQQNYAGITGR